MARSKSISPRKFGKKKQKEQGLSKLAMLVSLPEMTHKLVEAQKPTLIHQTSVWHSLQKHAHKLQILSQSENYFSNPHHLRSLLLDRDRCSSFNLEHGGIVLDFSRQRLDYAALSSLFGNLARCYPALNTSSQFVALFLLFLLCRFSRTSWRAQADS